MMQPPGAPAAQTTGTLWRLLFRPLRYMLGRPCRRRTELE